MSRIRRWGLPAFLLCLPVGALTAGAGWAADEKPSATDVIVRSALKEVINEGADMYNAQGKYLNMERDYTGCYRLYEGALIAVKPLLSDHKDLVNAIDEGLKNAADTPELVQRAFVLRDVIDKIRKALNPNKDAVPPKITETTLKGVVTRVSVTGEWIEFKMDDGQTARVDFSKDTELIIDGQKGKPEDIRKDSKVTVVAQGKIASKIDAKLPLAPPPPPPAEKLTPGKVVKAEKGKLIASVGGEDMTFVVPDDATVTVDGKAAKVEDIKKDSSVTVTTKGNIVSKVEATSPTPPPAPKLVTVLGKVVGVDKDKLTVSVDEKEKPQVFTVPSDAVVSIDAEKGKLADIKKDSDVTVVSKDGVVASVDAKSPPPPPKEKKTTGKVTKVSAAEKILTIKVEDKDTTFLVSPDATITIDGKDAKLDAVKVDSTATVTSTDAKVTKVEVKAPAAPPAETLWDRLGGETGVAKVVDDFVNTAGKDPKVNFWRDPTDTPGKERVADLKKQLVAFVSSATGGPIKYTGKNMKEAHKGMKISDEEFNALAADLKAALEKNGVKPDDVKAVMDTVEGTRKDIVEVKGTGEKPEPGDKPAETGNVSGKVTYKGQPIPGGTVTLTSADGKTYAAPITDDGTYKLKDVKPGEYKVAIETDSAKPKPGEDKPAAKYVAIPAKYKDASTSGLTFKVEKGENVHDFSLAD